MQNEPTTQDREFLSTPLLLTEENLLRLREILRPELIALGRQILGDPTKAEDVLTDLVTYLLRKISKEGAWEIHHPRGWFYKIYRRRVYGASPSPGDQSSFPLEISLSPAQEGEPEVELPDENAALQMERKLLAEELMRMMPDDLRWMVEMRAFGYQWKQLAEEVLNDPKLQQMFGIEPNQRFSTKEEGLLSLQKLTARLRKLYQREITELATRHGWK